MQNHDIKFFGLTTCLPCRKTREFLEQKKVPFELIYVDALDDSVREKTIEEVRGYNPQLSFPTVVVDGGAKVIVGFQPEAIAAAVE